MFSIIDKIIYTKIIIGIAKNQKNAIKITLIPKNINLVLFSLTFKDLNFNENNGNSATNK